MDMFSLFSIQHPLENIICQLITKDPFSNILSKRREEEKEEQGRRALGRRLARGLILWVPHDLLAHIDKITSSWKHEALMVPENDLGLLKYFLGIEVLQSRHGIVLSQMKYALDLLEETRMMGCKPTDTPMDSNTKLCGGALGRELPYKNYGHFNIEGFSDADRTCSPDDRKSTSGFCTMVGGTHRGAQAGGTHHEDVGYQEESSPKLA
ncbi:uncharacterized protein [Aristolochia californica]|uniref:uncharacterized protein n=1 Tax=Aristolochia californica TaxID=171875 RepID=UPI0035DEBF72